MHPHSKLSTVFFVVCCLFILYLFARVLEPFFTPLVFAVILATLFFRTYEKLSKRMGRRPNAAAAVMCLGITLVIILPLVALLIIVSQQIVDTYQNLQGGMQGTLADFQAGRGTLGRAVESAERALHLDRAETREGIKSALQTAGAFMAAHSLGILGGLAGLIMDFFITIFTLFFLFRDGRTLRKELGECVPLAPEYKERILESFAEVIRATFISTYVTGLVQGVLAGLIYWILGVPHAVLWAATTAVFSLVPVIGTAAVWVPITLFLMLTGHVVKGLVLVAAGSLLIGMVDNVVRPLVIQGTSKGMHVLLIFFGVLGGLSVFGFSGLVLGPVVVGLLLVFMDIYKTEFKDDLKLQ
ncbi:MAG: AI-2E family transporter [Acidobacteriota bacterium]